jgi:hypothetical protein
MGSLVRRLLRVGFPMAVLGGLYVLVARGMVTIDLGLGRRVRPLGPMLVEIEAPRELVFDVISSPYLGRTPHAMEDKLKVLERGTDAVLADHHTKVGPITTSTVEMVIFERPHRVRFHLVRGPVPHVVEQFELSEDGGHTQLGYSGEMGADLWGLGRKWSDIVARRWERVVSESLEQIRVEAERRARAR